MYPEPQHRRVGKGVRGLRAFKAWCASSAPCPCGLFLPGGRDTANHRPRGARHWRRSTAPPIAAVLFPREQRGQAKCGMVW